MYLYIQQNLYELVVSETLNSSKLVQNERLKQINNMSTSHQSGQRSTCG